MRLILCFIMILSSQLVFGQNGSRTFLTKQGKVITQLKTAVNSRSAVAERTYYYVSAGELVITQGSFEGDWLHGLTSFYDQKGVLESKGSFKNGLKHGKWLYWNPEGKLIEIITWKNGLKSGYYKALNSLSTYEEGQWNKNFKHGTWRTIQNGELVKVEHFKMGQSIEPKAKKVRKHKFNILKFKKKKKEEPVKEEVTPNKKEVPAEKDEKKEKS